MTNNRKNRLILILVGFFLLFIPLFFFCYSLKKLYSFNEEKAKDSLRQKILSTARNIEEKLNPYNYLQSEFDKIHSLLLPDFPQTIIYGIPDDSYMTTLYSESLNKKLLDLTVKNFSPIIITFATNNFEKIYPYYSPKLYEDLKSNNEEQIFLDAKIYFDYQVIYRMVEHFFNKNFEFSPYITRIRTDKSPKNYEIFTYKYLSKFNNYDRNLTPMFTDYYQNQTLYPIIKYTISKIGIHGYYSLLIPQSSIKPDSIINNILLNQPENIKIQLKKNKENTKFNETENGLEYCLNFTTDFISHVNAYNRLRGIKNKNNILDNQFKISIDYPKELINLYNLKIISYFLSVLISLLYLCLSTIVFKKKKSFHLLITPKLICILSIIIILPIGGIGLSTWMSAQNLNELIDHNVSQCLNNELNNYSTINEEINLRFFSFNLEMKKKIAQGELIPKVDLFNSFLTMKDTLTWYNCWMDNTYAFSEDGNVFLYDSNGYYQSNNSKYNREEKYYKLFFLRYFNNLGLVKDNPKNDKFNTFSLSLLEQYLTPEIEEKTIPFESIPQREIFNFKPTNSAGYFLAKDRTGKYHYIMTRKYGTSRAPYNYIDRFTETIAPFWFRPENEFANMELASKLNTYSERRDYQWPSKEITSEEVTNLLKKAIETEDSGQETTKTKETTKIKQWLFTYNEPYVIAGIAESKYDTMFSFPINMIFPILFAYAILLLMVLTSFISVFINKSIEIYKRAIKQLNNNQYGTTINSFSKDEFDNITKAFNEMSIAIKQKEQIKRYVSEKLVESVDVNKIQKAGEGKIEKLTILSSDIRNFTGISEIEEPTEIVEMLNTYFTRMQQVISANGGIIDKYIGDAIQAVFYDEPNKESHILRAAKAALDMRKALKEYNKERKKSGLFTIENGIGIDTDIAITGTIGSKNGRKDYSVNGDVIARAATLEAKTKMTESKILMSKKSLEELDCHDTQCPAIACSNTKFDEHDITHTTYVRNEGLIYKVFDEESVELIDVRQ
jgi:class 3 adenylate cyclase